MLKKQYSKEASDELRYGEWAVAYFDFTDVDGYLNTDDPTAVVKQIHVKPFGEIKTPDFSGKEENNMLVIDHTNNMGEGGQAMKPVESVVPEQTQPEETIPEETAPEEPPVEEEPEPVRGTVSARRDPAGRKAA